MHITGEGEEGEGERGNLAAKQAQSQIHSVLCRLLSASQSCRSTLGQMSPELCKTSPQGLLGVDLWKFQEPKLLAPNACCPPSTPTYPEVQVVFDIPEKAAYHCSKMDDMGGLYLLEQSLGLCCIPEGSQDVRAA